MAGIKRRYPSLDVVKMYSTLTLEHWRDTLLKAMKSGSKEKLISWRYGLQAGLADAESHGMNSDQLSLWVIKRCRDVEKCMKFIIRKESPNPLDNPSGKIVDRLGYVAKAVEAKKKRDREFETFLMKSNF